MYSCQRIRRPGGKGKSVSIDSQQLLGLARQRDTYGWSLHSKVGKKNALRTFPLLLWCRDLRRLQFPLAEVWNCVNDDPWYAATEINGLLSG
jgi:hypothetical protein